MTTVNSNSAASNASTATTATKAAGSMDQKDFLRLMTAQLTTQDPFNPVDNTQMVAQMAQFSQVAGIAEMNASLKSLVEGMGGSRISDAASWIGRSVLAESDVATPLKDGSYAGEAVIPEDADTVSIAYVNAQGAILHEETRGATKAGTIQFNWNGKNGDGEAVPGPVKLIVTARKGADQLATPTATWATVTGIQSPANGGSTKLLTSVGSLDPADALRLA